MGGWVCGRVGVCANKTPTPVSRNPPIIFIILFKIIDDVIKVFVFFSG